MWIRDTPEHVKVEAVVKRFGAAGRNSFRADLAVLDVPVAGVSTEDTDELLRHSLVLGEVKRDNASFTAARSTQVEPLLDFASRDDCIAIYWDDVEQRVFWQERHAGVREKHEGPLAMLPQFGNTVTVKPLTLSDLAPTDSLLGLFNRIEDVPHAASADGLAEVWAVKTVAAFLNSDYGGTNSSAWLMTARHTAWKPTTPRSPNEASGGPPSVGQHPQDVTIAAWATLPPASSDGLNAR